MTPKEPRRAIYQWLASEGFTWTKERHRTLKKLLTTPTDQPEEVQEPELLDDNDPHLLSPAEDEEK
jgi:hypothetical protein